MKRLGTYAHKLSYEEIKQVKEFYREGWNLRELADRFGVTRQAIHYLLKVRGIETRPRHPKRPNGTNGKGVHQQRDEAGVIVTVREQTSERIFSFREPGPFAMQAVADRLDFALGDWKVICYSSPPTITRDLAGSRGRQWQAGGALDTPEAQALSQIGRLDLLDPRIFKGDPRDLRRREE